MTKTIGYVVLSVLMAGLWVSLAGNLQPPGPPAPTMKPLDQVEPRIPIRASSLPLTITTPGSYYLVENIVTSGPGITIGADDVSIDLMGFALRGGGGHGIWTNAERKNLEIKNGTIAGWSANGIEMSTANSTGRVTNIRAEGNGGVGIAVAFGAVVDSLAIDNDLGGIYLAGGVVSGCHVMSNGGIGIDIDDGTVSHSLAGANAGDGIDIASGTVSDCEAVFNGGSGIRAGIAATVRGCTATRNTSHGIVAFAGALITESTVTQNSGDGINVGDGVSVTKCTVYRNLGDGIDVQNRASQIVGNHCFDNGSAGAGFGISATALAVNLRVEDNHVTGNRGGGIRLDGTGSLVVGNSAVSNLGAGNYIIAPGNRVGSIVSTPVGAGAWNNFN